MDIIMIRDIKQAYQFSKKYCIPVEDIILITLNCCGIKADLPDKRIRFKLKLNTFDELFYFALCVNTKNTPFSLRGNKLFFNQDLIGHITDRENDTCDSTYFRRNKTVLTLNSNSRSKCRGCKFCGTYNQDAEDINNLLTEERLGKRLNEILVQNNIKDLSGFIDVSICTGCFEDEKEALDHILMVRRTLNKFGFNRELKYIGSQITTETNLKDIQANAKPFALYFTVECFTRREELLRHNKAAVKIPDIKRILKSATDKGFDTSILYILGLESPEVVIKNFQEFLPYMTRFPIIDVFQNYLPEHELLRHPEARSIEYYLKIRKEIEKIYKDSNLRIRPWENYRPLWYLKFDKEKISDIRI